MGELSAEQGYRYRGNARIQKCRARLRLSRCPRERLRLEQDGTVSTAELGAIELSSQNQKATQRIYRIEATANMCRARAPACPIAAVAASCAFRQAGSAAATVARPFRVTATTRERASSLPVRI
jgi:hypothetical protein